MKKTGTLLLFLCFITAVLAQKTDTIYISTRPFSGGIVKKKADADLTIFSTASNNNKSDKVYDKQNNLKITFSSRRSPDSLKKVVGEWALHGSTFLWRKKNTIQKEFNFFYGLKHGAFKEYYESGKLLQMDTFHFNNLVSSYFYNDFGEKFLVFREGMQPALLPKVRNLQIYLQQYFYSVDSDFNYKPYEIYIKFVVKTDGTTKDVRIFNSNNRKMDKKLFELILKLPKFSPAIFNNLPIETTIVVPLKRGVVDWVNILKDI